MRVATRRRLSLLATPVVAAVPLDAAIEAAERNGFTGVVALKRLEGAALRARRRLRRSRTSSTASPRRALAVGFGVEAGDRRLVMQEVERKRLTLDTTVRSVLKDFPRGDVTIRQLLEHTAGLANPTDTATARTACPRSTANAERRSATRRARAAIARAGRRARRRAPSGTTTATTSCWGPCSNGSTTIVMRTSCATRIAEPSGARTLRVARDGEAPAGADPLGYESTTKRSPPINVATLGAAGALVGTTRDVLAFESRTDEPSPAVAPRRRTCCGAAIQTSASGARRVVVRRAVCPVALNPCVSSSRYVTSAARRSAM